MCDIDTMLPENLCKTESCDDDVQEMDYGAHNETHKEDFDELQILKEDTVKIVIIILSCMCKNGIKILTTFGYDSRKTNDLGTCANNDQKLELAVVFE